jgi:hypothetical protein
VWLLRLLFKPNLDLVSAKVKGYQVLKDVGGAEAVLREAEEVFRTHGRFDGKKLNSNDLSAFPTLAKLGDGVVVLSGTPGYLSIHVGTHRDGLFFKILNTNGLYDHKEYAGEEELAEKRIYVHR